MSMVDSTSKSRIQFYRQSSTTRNPGARKDSRHALLAMSFANGQGNTKHPAEIRGRFIDHTDQKSSQIRTRTDHNPAEHIILNEWIPFATGTIRSKTVHAANIPDQIPQSMGCLQRQPPEILVTIRDCPQVENIEGQRLTHLGEISRHRMLCRNRPRMPLSSSSRMVPQVLEHAVKSDGCPTLAPKTSPSPSTRDTLRRNPDADGPAGMGASRHSKCCVNSMDTGSRPLTS